MPDDVTWEDAVNWILQTGEWDDLGVWDDTRFWVDNSIWTAEATGDPTDGT